MLQRSETAKIRYLPVPVGQHHHNVHRRHHQQDMKHTVAVRDCLLLIVINNLALTFFVFVGS